MLKGEEETTKEQVASAVFAQISAVAKEMDMTIDKSTGGGVEDPSEWYGAPPVRGHMLLANSTNRDD